MSKQYLLLLSFAVLLICSLSVHATTVIGGDRYVRLEVKEYIIKHNLTGYVNTIVLKNYDNNKWMAYTWYRGKIIYIYKQTWKNNTMLYPTLRHEIGHQICENKRLNTFNYAHNEACADRMAEGLV